MVRVLSGLGLLLLTAAQPKAISWHSADGESADHDPANQPLAGGQPAPTPDDSDAKHKKPPLTLASTLPATISPRAPVASIAEATRQAGIGGRPGDTDDFGDCAAADCPEAWRTLAAAATTEIAFCDPLDRALRANSLRQLLTVICPAGPPSA